MADLGFRGKEVDADNLGVQIIHRGRYKSLSKPERGWLKRRQAVEPAIVQLKSDHRLDRCWLKGALGERLQAISCAAGSPALAAGRHRSAGHRAGSLASASDGAVGSSGHTCLE